LYKGDGTVDITIYDYLESCMDITRTAGTPAKRDMFEIDENAQMLGKRYAEIFHSVAAKHLYVSIRARMDILMPVIFLCTRVSKSTVQDQAKLRRVLGYVNGTLHYKTRSDWTK
jgi:hypothetical protein